MLLENIYSLHHIVIALYLSSTTYCHCIGLWLWLLYYSYIKGEQKKTSQSFFSITWSNFTQILKSRTFWKNSSSWLLKNVQDHWIWVKFDYDMAKTKWNTTIISLFLKKITRRTTTSERYNKRKMKDSGSRLPRSKYWTWEPTPRIKIFSLGAGSQVQNLDPGSRLPSSKSWSWEPTPRVKIFTLGAGSQVPNLYSGSRLPSSKSWPWEPTPRNLGVKCLHLSILEEA